MHNEFDILPPTKHYSASKVGAFVLCLILGLGCTSSVPKQNLSQAQLNAIETREVDAGVEETFRAASNALFDAGYTIAMSDKSAGLITGSKAKDRASERFWVDPTIQDTKFLVSIQITPIDTGHTMARIKTSINGEPYTDAKAIDQLWVLMQRQVLMKAPPPLNP